MKKLMSLTKEQEAMLPHFLDKWIKIGLSTERSDRKTAEEGFREAYLVTGNAPPELILWADSPLEGVKFFSILVEEKKYLESIPKEDIQGYLTKKAKDPNYKISNSIRVTDGLNYGQFDASWISYYDTFQSFGVEGLEPLNGLKKVCMSTGWTWFFGNVVISSERPLYIKRNDIFELHSEDSPAIEYPDGYKLYFWNGVPLDPWIIENPEKITIEKIKKEKNAEVARIMREIYGTGRYLADTKSVIIDTDTIPIDKLEPKGESIIRALVKDDTGETYLVGSDGSTDRVYFMRVPNGTKTCDEAHKLLSGSNTNQIVMEG